jgi:hypothetical protein
VPRSVHAGAVHKLGVTMVTRSSVARRTNVAIPAPPWSTGEMVNLMGHLDALHITMASLARRVAVVEVAPQRHTAVVASIDGRFDQLMGLVQGLHGNRGVVFGPPPPPPGTGVPDPHSGPIFPYPYKLPQGPEMIPGHPVSPVSRLTSSLS